MTELTQDGRQALAEIASRHGVSFEAAEHVLGALVAGQGTLAQFNHPDLGGMGQWSMGGMTMVGDMFNNALKAKVDALCSDVAQLMRQSPVSHPVSATSAQSQSQGDQTEGGQAQGNGVSLFVSGGSTGNWWPENLGHAASTGAQNRMRYAWFPETARLAIDAGDGKVRVYDTTGHTIGGFSQQQSGDQSLSFTSQHGLVKLSELPEIETTSSVAGDESEPRQNTTLSEALLNTPGAASNPDPVAAQPDNGKADPAPEQAEAPNSARSSAAEPADEADIFAKIERLAALHAKGILTDAEYQGKKAELLARI